MELAYGASKQTSIDRDTKYSAPGEACIFSMLRNDGTFGGA
jgi:hypothetical protein